MFDASVPKRMSRNERCADRSVRFDLPPARDGVAVTSTKLQSRLHSGQISRTASHTIDKDGQMPEPTVADDGPMPTEPREPLEVVIVGGGIAGAEALLALRALAGERVALRLVSASDRLVLPALAVAEPFALGSTPSYPLDDLVASAGAELILGSLAAVDRESREIRLDDGQQLSFQALVLAVGATAVQAVEGATTWWPRGDPDAYGGLLRDLEEGYIKRVAFVIPPGAVWPLPAYELALMTSREVDSMGIDDVELTVITPEASPLTLMGAGAATALRQELDDAGVRLRTATVARVQRTPHLHVVLEPTNRTLPVDRVVALPEVRGLAIPGTDHDERGFIRVHDGWRMRGAENIWAIGDAAAYPVKFGGLATQQADQAAADIARLTGIAVATPDRALTLRGVLLTGSTPRALGSQPGFKLAHRPMWRPEDKVHGHYLSAYLGLLDREPTDPAPAEGDATMIDETLPGQAAPDELHALWRDDKDTVARLGHAMHDYRAMHAQTRQLLHEHGQLGHP
jgi:sulfide:quinone oxidoreductase